MQQYVLAVLLHCFQRFDLHQLLELSSKEGALKSSYEKVMNTDGNSILGVCQAINKYDDGNDINVFDENETAYIFYMILFYIMTI